MRNDEEAAHNERQTVCYAIICEKHHGRIWVETKPGKGATFIIELPLTQES
ncbi:MAG: hypothetical protein U9R57_05980 [Thermodesulfobacteriota bacterium]|nr:hypothetical protein [Thermodesulfobacteriota bacterium]